MAIPTMGMINMAADVISRDTGTKPVIIYQMTWSNGGDCIVVKPGIKTAKDLSGKTIALQAYGPHVDYLAKILKDAGLSMSDVRIRWTKDLTGTENAPAEALYDKDVDATFVIIPDGLMKEVKTFVHGLMLAKQEMADMFRNKDMRMAAYKKMLGGAAQILLDSPQATGDAESLYGDCEYVGFRGNVRFFGDEKWPRNMSRLTEEIQSAFISIRLLGSRTPLEHAKWNYDELRVGLTGIDDVESPKFRQEEVAKIIAKKQAMGTLGEGELFSFEINFQPNQKIFSEDLYIEKFGRVMELASAYGGAVITVEGHTDPQKYNKLEKKGVTPIILRQTRQAAKNLSINRALAVRNSVIKFAENKGIPADQSQFTVIGHGISQPRFPKPETKEQWLSNMRVVFRIIQIEAEESVFEPLE